jgi:DHA1 family tetracycline resistance protein-like MFS transporter
MDPRLPFWVAAALSFTNAVYGWLILPESLPKERRSPFRWKSANPLGALRLLRSNRVLAGLSLANFFGQVAHVSLPSTFVLYAAYRYDWDAKTSARWRWSASAPWWCRRGRRSSVASASNAGRCCSG